MISQLSETVVAAAAAAGGREVIFRSPAHLFTVRNRRCRLSTAASCVMDFRKLAAQNHSDQSRPRESV